MKTMSELRVRGEGASAAEASVSGVVGHPAHYNAGTIEVIDAIEDWGLGFHLGNVVKYVARSPHKGEQLADLKKARWYLDREIQRIEHPDLTSKQAEVFKQVEAAARTRPAPADVLAALHNVISTCLSVRTRLSPSSLEWRMLTETHDMVRAVLLAPREDEGRVSAPSRVVVE